MAADLRLLEEVENAVTLGNSERRSGMLRQMTDLFIVEADRCSAEKIELFDDVLTRLAAEIETSARALLAERLAPVPNAPPRIIRALAFDDAIEVAQPVLTLSERLDEQSLVENAKQKSQEHLLAISRRRVLSERITDVLVARGDRQVVQSVVDNRGARFSSSGFGVLVRRAEGDDQLATSVGSRPEIPPILFARLLEKASARVRAKLEAERPDARRQIHEVVSQAAARIDPAAFNGTVRSTVPNAIVETLHRTGRLDEGKLKDFAKEGRLAETTAALALMCRLPLHFIEQTIGRQRPETLLVLARALRLSWPTAKALLHLRGRSLAPNEIAQHLASFERLKPETAQEILRFYQRQDLSKHDPGKLN
ncbi:MAG: DUF2336 domain-containing protein [Hyphomicrobiales bacterium]|nr:DUF2336 domain-containing protein [Hyphomicrobiales bacterium]